MKCHFLTKPPYKNVFKLPIVAEYEEHFTYSRSQSPINYTNQIADVFCSFHSQHLLLNGRDAEHLEFDIQRSNAVFVSFLFGDDIGSFLVQN